MDIIDSVLRTLQTIPPLVWAVLAGSLASWGATQRVKRYIPDWCVGWGRSRVTEVLAFAIGAAVTLVIEPTRAGMVAALLVGVWSPMSWKLLLALLEQYRPDLRAALSGDKTP